MSKKGGENGFVLSATRNNELVLGFSLLFRKDVLRLPMIIEIQLREPLFYLLEK